MKGELKQNKYIRMALLRHEAEEELIIIEEEEGE